jgi:hypothetical protein
MGSAPAAEIMHIIVSALARLPPALQKGVTTRVHVDNVRYLGQDEATLEKVAKFVDERLKQFAVTINDAISVKTRDEFFGLDFDYKAGTVTLTDKHRKKLNRLLDNLNTTMTARDIMQTVGTCLYVSRAVKHHMAVYYPALKLLRQTCREFADDNITLSTHCAIAPATIRNIVEWLTTLIRHAPTRCRAPDHTYTLVSDASNQGWAAIVIGAGKTHVIQGKWSLNETTLHINAKELRAVRKGLALVPRGETTSVVVDNMTAIGAARRGYSAAFPVNTEVAAIHRITDHRRIAIASWRFVNTAANPADEPSRGLPTSGTKLQHFVRHWG